ncbi:polyphenol oxidase family protein [uncultured Helicobacter sp.]|uniref:polyphenol oxidase family protein n=1 Tax=uncultured Helicobacter sp. TaxID=175537 RepID=UPI0026021C3C|nr:polyphenol oxidase family protein [uncultured Helicobacter sp.]
MTASSIFYSSDQSPLFSSHRIRFAQTCALGGVSPGPYASCNIAYHVGDNPESVHANRSQILRHFDNKPLLWCNQIHSTILADSTSDLLALLHGEAKADGIICADSSYVALIMVADCNPILLYDPREQIFALLHAGRAGVCGRILTQAVEALRARGANPANMLVFIGSSIRSCCYEIGQNLCGEIARDFGEHYIKIQANASGNTHTLDMIAMLIDECESLGIARQNLEILDSCTSCDERLFSYRRACKHGCQSGRFGLFVRLL